MNNVKRLLFLSFILIIFLCGCSSNASRNVISETITHKPASTEPQSTRKPEMKFSSGLLLGLRNDIKNGDKIDSTYRTLWIVPENDGLKLMVQGGFILAPYGDDFSIIESKTVNEDIQYISSYKVGTQPQDRIFKTQSDAEKGEDIITNNHIKLLFVGNKYVSYSYEVYEYTVGTPHGLMNRGISVNEISGIDSGDNSLDIESLLGKGASKIAEEARKKVKVDYDTGNGLFEPEYFDIMWGITRSNGRFIPQVCRIRQLRSQGIDYATGDIPISLPKSITAYDELAPSWNEIQKTIPDASDAISSPKKDIVAVIVNHKLVLYSCMNGKIRNNLLDVALKENESIVMVQWASGQYVDKWSQEVVKYLK